MASRILRLVKFQAQTAPAPVAPDVPARLHFWRGASGQRYVHNVYSLMECPPLPRATYVLARRDENGPRKVLHIACATSEAPTLNLARIRQRGARLGANEVHVHLLARTDEQRRNIACDLRAGQFRALSAEPPRVS
jgi:hypothetical protein